MYFIHHLEAMKCKGESEKDLSLEIFYYTSIYFVCCLGYAHISDCLTGESERGQVSKV
jgi:hypothetical protein